MRIKWLDWTPGAGFVGFEGRECAAFAVARAVSRNASRNPSPHRETIIEKGAAREPAKPTEPEPAADGGMPVDRASEFWGSRGDAYSWRADLALDAICRISIPEDLTLWLEANSPYLYGQITRVLPDKISRAWNGRDPLDEFDCLCRDLVETFRRAAKLYTATRTSPRP